MTVLIVDDEKIVAESTAEIFRLAGHRASAVTSPARAVELAREMQPDILITDVLMPEENGIALAVKIQAMIPQCKVLLTSGQAETSNLLDEAEQRGLHFDIVAKPLWPPELVKRAEQLAASEPNSQSAIA